MNERPRTDHAAFRPAQLCQFALKRRQVMGPLSVVQRQLHTSPPECAAMRQQHRER